MIDWRTERCASVVVSALHVEARSESRRPRRYCPAPRHCKSLAHVRGGPPLTKLSYAFTIGNQLEETFLRHHRTTRREARKRAVAMLERVGITAAAHRLRQYPHQLSGGLCQRVMIAMALICRPDLLIADEPTTALDVTIQAEILHLLMELQDELRMALILITHDLGIVARMADRVAVMYAGQIIETGPTRELFAEPLHPYTRALLDCIPVPGRSVRGTPLGSIPGRVPTLVGDLGGCHFRNRCGLAHDACAPAPIPLRTVSSARASRCVLGATRPARADVPRPVRAGAVLASPESCAAPLLEVLAVTRRFHVSAGFFRRKRVLDAVNGVSLAVGKGEVVGLVGESGCGKSTLALMLLGLLRPTDGEILLDGRKLTEVPRPAIARRIQPILQDPYGSLNPHKTVATIIGLPLRIHGIGDRATQRRTVLDMMDRVGLAPRYADLHPAQLSGGQRQRVAIARALVMRPDVVICDEPTSALDVSVQAQILNLLLELRRELRLTYLLISHNLAVVERMATRVAVMYLGRIVEAGPTDEIFGRPRHPYTRALLESVLTPEPDLPVPDPHLGATVPNPLDRPTGCSFHPRCPQVLERCRSVAPMPVAVGETPLVECHLYDASG